jgi:SAM-dependent methyltransferase
LISMMPPGRALDVGCGHGTEALFLASCGWSVIGIDRDRAAIDIAEKRRRQLDLPRGAVRFEARNALDYREPSPGRFDLVIERLLYVNLFPEGPWDRRTAEEYRRDRRHLIVTAAYALRSGAHFLIRLRPHGPTWRTIAPDDSLLTADDRRLLHRYFEADWREIPFSGLATPVVDTSDGPLLQAVPLDLTLALLRRSDRAPPR